MRLQVELMADTSPMCSIIVANASGMMVMMAVMARPASNCAPKMENTVSFQVNGMPIHAASATPVKSTTPAADATTYDPTTPNRMGMILIMPLPQMFAMTMMAMATSAMGQFVDAFVMAELARMRPMEITMGPVTTGGKKRMTRVGPNTLNSADSTRYSRPAHATPRQAYGSRSASPFGAMAA